MLFNIKIDKALTSYLASKKIRLEELFVIACFNLGKIDVLKDYLTGRNGDQIIAYLQPLVRKQLLKILTSVDEFDWDNYELTDLADSIFDDCNQNIFDGEIGNHLTEMTVSVPVPKGLTEEQFSKLVSDFIGLFPAGIRNRGGELLTSHPADVVKKMKAFVNKYKYSVDTVLQATTYYLNRMRQDGYAWCSAAHFFISKNGISKLASECEQIEKGERKDSDVWDNAM